MKRSFQGYTRIVKSFNRGSDGRIRDVGIEYFTFNEATKRETLRPVMNIVMLHPVDELGIMQEICPIGSIADCLVVECNACPRTRMIFLRYLSS